MSDLPEQEAVKVVSIQAGNLRQRVKSRELHPRDVLEWLKTQSYVSKNLVTWLRNKTARWNSIPAKKEEKVEEVVEKKSRKRDRRDRKGRKNEQHSADSGRTDQ